MSRYRRIERNGRVAVRQRYAYIPRIMLCVKSYDDVSANYWHFRAHCSCLPGSRNDGNLLLAGN